MLGTVGVRRASSAWILLGFIISAGSALRLAAQSQPGRIVVDNTGPSILEFNIDGSNGFTIAGNTDNNSVFSPSVASNGTIAFTANTDVDGTYLGQPYVFLMNADGTNVRNITRSLPGPSTNCCYNLNPAISPDATSVAFLATINAAPDGSRTQQIYVVNADGSNLRQLTPFIANPNSSPADYSQNNVDGLAWSPDSTTLAFRGSVYTSQCGTYFGNPIWVNVIGTIKADGTGMQTLACDNNDGYVTSIDWSPDGTLLAWGRNVDHGAQGCSGCVGEPAMAFYDFSGQNRYSGGITSSVLGTDSCQGGPHCIHFSPDSSQLAYVDAYPNNGNPCQSGCNVSFINLDGSGQTSSTIPSGGHTVWWAPGQTIPAPAQITVAGPNGPTATVEVWPGFSQQVTPTLSDSTSDLILHTAQNYLTTHYFYGSNCLAIGPFGLAVYTSGGGGNGYGTIYATNAGLTSNTINFNCWPSPPCTFSLSSNSTEVSASGGAGTVGVTADPGATGSTCPWSATSNASWITITSGVNGTGNGSVSFRVAVNSGPSRQATISIAGLTYTVTQDAGGTATLQSIATTPNPAAVAAGQSVQFTATGHYSDGSTKNLTNSVTWASSNSGIATISNAAGSQGSATGVSAGGPITITAASNGISGTAQLTVTAPVLVSIAVTPANSSVPAGSTQQFTATGTYSDGSTSNITTSVTWTSTNTSVATINSSGSASALSGGSSMISATKGSVSGSTNMAVTITLQSITVSPANSSTFVGSTLQFMATGHYSDNSTGDLTASVVWTSSNTSVASISSPGGLATGVAKGTASIAAASGAISGSTPLTVSAVALGSITVSPATAAIAKGGTQQFTATGNYNNGTTRDLTATVMWSSSSKKVATMTSPGLFTGKGTGSTTITAKMKLGSGPTGSVTGSASLTVQ